MDFSTGNVAFVIAFIAFIAIVFLFTVFLASRYKRCPSDSVLVVYGKVGTGQSAKCIHGGGTMVWPLIQASEFLSLIPMTISIPLSKALSKQNIRINVPSTFTVGVGTRPEIMNNAAERLLGLPPREIEEMAKEIIFGQLRLTVASLTIEQINQDRDSFLGAIRSNVEPELNKIGLNLINVNITDITDESDYIESIGKKAASEATNRAMIDVAEQEKLGAIGQAEANRERAIRVAEHQAEADKGQKKADADRRIFVQQQETSAAIGEAEALRDKDVNVAQNEAEADKGRKKADADRRVFVQDQEAMAIQGENESKGRIAASNAELAKQEAEAHQAGEVARRQAELAIQRAEYAAETERLKAVEVARAETDKIKVELAAQAEAARQRETARGAADATLLKYEAEAAGVRQVLDSKAEGYRALVESCGNDARAAATLLMVEKLEEIVAKQVDAVKNLRIDKITVWDSGAANGDGTSTSNFLSNMIRTLPPLHEVARMAGVELPEYLGTASPDPARDEAPTNGVRADGHSTSVATTDADPA